MVFETRAQDFPDVESLKGAQVGDTVINFHAIDQDSNLFSLKEALKEGPVVIMFYRGQWCPVCNRHMKKVQDSLALINKKGARLIAVSPEKPEFLQKSAKKSGAKFTLLYDSAYQIGLQFDVIFQPDQRTRNKYNRRLDAQLDQAHTDDTERLPIPATFIINKEGVIVWRHFNPDYKIRASVSQILEHLPAH